jgi:hypothetical protein
MHPAAQAVPFPICVLYGDDGRNPCALAAGDGTDHDEGFLTGGDGFGKRCVGRFVREILLAGEEAKEGAALFGDVIANRALQHGIAGFERVEDRSLRDGAVDFDFNFVADAGEGAKMLWKFDADHG